jgi:hypothetical protein
MTRDVVDRETLIAFALGKLSREDSLDVLAAVERDPLLSDELEEVLLLARGTAAVAEGGGRKGRSTHEPAIRYLFRAAAVVIILLSSAVVASKLTTGRYHELARLGESDYSLSWRGEMDNDVEWARNAFLAGDRDGAIGQLERIINSHPEGEQIEGVHWMVGAMMLAGSERSVVGLFPRYDERFVDRGMAHLAISARSANPRIAEESHWLRMKGFLMLAQPDSAKREGEAVVRASGRLSLSADTVIKKIGY